MLLATAPVTTWVPLINEAGVALVVLLPNAGDRLFALYLVDVKSEGVSDAMSCICGFATIATLIVLAAVLPIAVAASGMSSSRLNCCS